MKRGRQQAPLVLVLILALRLPARGPVNSAISSQISYRAALPAALAAVTVTASAAAVAGEGASPLILDFSPFFGTALPSARLFLLFSCPQPGPALLFPAVKLPRCGSCSGRGAWRARLAGLPTCVLAY